MNFTEFFDNKSVALTGSVGTIGSVLATALLELPIRDLQLVDNNESGLYEQMLELNDKRVSPWLLDIADQAGLTRAFSDVDYVIHAATFKHVPLCENEPQSAVRNNIVGTQCVIDAALTAGVKKVLYTSSDKAVNPTNVMGISKLMGERLITAANLTKSVAGTKFASTRFGSVLGSRGSVSSIYLDRISKGQNLPLTHRSMSRFIMSPAQASSLLLQSLHQFVGGEIFVTKMPSVKIEDFAQMMIECFADKLGYQKSDFRVELIGARPGEKLFEELLTGEELSKTIALDKFFVILPDLSSNEDLLDHGHYRDIGAPVDTVYTSETQSRLSIDEGVALINQSGIFSRET